MSKGAITQYVDVAQVVLYFFWAFFAYLIWYLRREDKREGYPLTFERTETAPYFNFPSIPPPKTFVLPHGGTVQAPRKEPPQPEIRAVPVAGWPGAPLEPTGDALLDAVGPGAYAMRANMPDLTIEGTPKIMPLRIAGGAPKHFSLSPRDPDPRGMQVIGADHVVAGVVKDVWIDVSEYIMRYLEVQPTGAEGTVLLPVNFSRIDRPRGRVQVQALLASQFADVPKLGKPGSGDLSGGGSDHRFLWRRQALRDAPAAGVVAVSEFDTEPVRGLPERPPQGETILWQGHAKCALACPAGCFICGRLASISRCCSPGASTRRCLPASRWRARSLSASSTLLVASAAMGLLVLLAWLVARNTVYTITNRRVVMRIGVALTITMNIPFSKIEAARSEGLRRWDRRHSADACRAGAPVVRRSLAARAAVADGAARADAALRARGPRGCRHIGCGARHQRTRASPV